MIDEILKYMAVYFTSMVKFIGGPLLGIGSGLTFWETALLTSLGMMTSVFVFTTFLGKGFKHLILRYFNKNRKLFTKKNRKVVKVWKSFGLSGVAFLTPILFTPIGGTIIATSFGETRKRIFMYMFLSAVFWSFIFSFSLFVLKNGLLGNSISFHF